jgi:hypothetical protein
MQLPEHSGLVSGLLEQLRKSCLGGIEGKTVIDFAIDMAMLAGKDHCTRGSADRICNTGIFEDHPLPGQPVDMRGADQPVTVCAYSLASMVVRYDKQDIGPAGLLFITKAAR